MEHASIRLLGNYVLSTMSCSTLSATLSLLSTQSSHPNPQNPSRVYNASHASTRFNQSASHSIYTPSSHTNPTQVQPRSSIPPPSHFFPPFPGLLSLAGNHLTSFLILPTQTKYLSSASSFVALVLSRFIHIFRYLSDPTSFSAT
jgi:hypothetical protein